MIVGIGLLLISVVASINFGAADLSYRDVYNALFQFDEDNPAHTIIRQLRFPRAVAAICVGAALAVSGAIMQGMTRNPLASPSIMGVTAGSSFLIAIALVVIPDNLPWFNDVLFCRCRFRGSIGFRDYIVFERRHYTCKARVGRLGHYLLA